MRLYEIAQQYREDLAKLQDTNLPPEAVLDTIEGMQGDITEKVKAVVVVAMELDEEAAVRAAHAKRMADSAKAMANRAESLRSYAQVHIQGVGLPLPIKYPEFTLNLQKNPLSCEITDEAALPDVYKNTEVKFSVKGDVQKLLPLLSQFLSDMTAQKVIASVESTAELTVKPDKKAVLDALKLIDAHNETAEQNERHALPGARLNPVSYRMTVK